jgi:hypothetical protein
MVSTVTTSTVTTVTTVTLAGAISLIAILALLTFLIQKEILSVSLDRRAQALHRLLNVAIVPLLISFGFIAVVRVFEVLN